MAHSTMRWPGRSVGAGLARGVNTRRGSARPTHRLHFLSLALSVCAVLAVGKPAHGQAAGQVHQFHPGWVERTTGRGGQGAPGIDRVVHDILLARNIAGGQLSIVGRGHLLFERGYGWADFPSRRPVEPDARFRIAELSHLLTSATALFLADRGRLDLDANPLEILRVEPTEMVDGHRRRATPDPRLANLTLAHLMRHESGWGFENPRLRTRDPIRSVGAVSQYLRVQSPSKRMLVEYAAGKPLEFTPGTAATPSMFNSVLLGEAIAHVMGHPIENVTRHHLLALAGVHGAEIGTTEEHDTVQREVAYFDALGREAVPYDERQRDALNRDIQWLQGERVVYCKGQSREPLPHALWDIELMGAGGGWVMSANELALAIGALDPGGLAMLSERARAWMLERPASAKDAQEWTSAGWQRVRETPDGLHAASIGSLSGTIAIAVRRPDGTIWVALFNTGSGDPELDEIEAIMNAIDHAVARAFGGPSPATAHPRVEP